jgi:hypothetical protein
VFQYIHNTIPVLLGLFEVFAANHFLFHGAVNLEHPRQITRRKCASLQPGLHVRAVGALLPGDDRDMAVGISDIALAVVPDDA